MKNHKFGIPIPHIQGELRAKIIPALIKATLAASFLELALLRVLSRLAMHIPRSGEGNDLTNAFFSLLSSAGVISYYLSYFLGFISLLFITWLGFNHPPKRLPAASGLILFLLIFTPLVEWNPTETFFPLVFDLAAIGSVSLISIPFLASGKGSGERGAVALILLAYLSFYYFKISQNLFQLLGVPSTPPLVTEALNIGEFIVVISGLAFFLSNPRRGFGNKKALILSSALTMLFLLALSLDPYAMSILATWSLGLRLYLPFPLYALALFLFSYTVLDHLWRGKNIGYGLAFIGIAGLTLSLPHQALKALLGLTLLCTHDQKR